MNKNIWTMLAAGIVCVILALAMFTFTVDNETQAVVYTFGAIRKDGVKKEPGLWFRWPTGIQSVVLVDTRNRSLAVRGNEPVTTRDENQIYLSLNLVWRVRDAETFIKRMNNDEGLSVEEKAARYLQDRVRDARLRAVNQFPLSALISDKPEQKKNYAAFQDTLLKTVEKEVARSDSGIELKSLEVTRISLAKSSSQAIFESMIKERTIRSEKNITDGKNEAMQIVNRANLQRQNLVSQAMADARRTKGEGDAAAAEHYKEFRKNPQLANFLRRLDTLEEILKNKATVALPVNNPLESLIENPPAAAATSR